MIKKIGVVVVVGGAVSLIISINRILHKGMESLEEANKTLAEVRHSIRGLTKESKQIIHSANQITESLKSKLDSVDPLLESVHEVGELIHNATHAVKFASDQTANKLPQIEPEINQKVRIKIGESHFI
jgi:uncharacterized protein YoxC